MSNIGTILFSKRLEQGLTLEQVAEKLKIRAKYIQAIEEDLSLPDTPSPVYMLGYLKMYADFLGLNGQAVVDKFKYTQQQASEFSFPDSYFNDQKPSKAILLGSTILMSFLIIAWFRITQPKDLWNRPFSPSAEMSRDYLCTPGSASSLLLEEDTVIKLCGKKSAPSFKI
jgi:cytoskeletal protein RodZ